MSGKPRVWISRPTFPDIIARLEPPFDITEEYAEQMVHGAELADRLAGQDAAMVGLKDRIGASEVASATRLRIVANLGVGYDNLDVAALSTAAVAVYSTPDLLIAQPAYRQRQSGNASGDDLAGGRPCTGAVWPWPACGAASEHSQSPRAGIMSSTSTHQK